jgi:PilZ domain
MEQRRADRRAACWRGAWLVHGESDTVGWRECQVVDISSQGVGLVLRHRRPSELVGHKIQVQVPARAGALSACLQGVVRNSVVTEAGFARVGIEFSGLTPAEEALAIVLDALTRTQLAADEPPREPYAHSRSLPIWTTERESPRVDLFL